MKNKPLPIVVLFVFGLLMTVIKQWLAIGQVHFAGQWIPFLVLVVLGLTIVLYCGYRFLQANTTFNPLQPEQASKLVVAGLYRYSRNPMYLGFFMILLGIGIYLGSLPALGLLPLFIIAINYLYILPEERALKRKFGVEYQEYQTRVRRWI